VRRLAAWTAILGLLGPGAVSAQRSGDPTPGSLAPLVVVVSPLNGGVVGARWRVQARVQHPSGRDAVASVSLAITGATTSTVALGRNPSYDRGADVGVWEGIVELAPGATVLLATATDGAGRSSTSAAVAVVANANLGDGNLLVRESGSQLCAACHGVLDHGSEATGRAYGAWTTVCRDCHAPHGARNAYLVRDQLRPPWVAGADAPAPRAVRFATRSGFASAGGEVDRAAASFANGDGTGPCQVCHTRTARWRADGVADPIHVGDCAFCHRHQAGFSARCERCHAAPPATGAHDAHAGASAPRPPFPGDPRPLGCGSCHPADPARHGDGRLQVVLSQGLVLPGGTSLAGAQFLPWVSTPPSCIVACHAPLGADANPQVWWGSEGPLPCTSCHSRIAPGGTTLSPPAGPSLHAPGFSEARPASGEPTTCFSCHAEGRHDERHLTGDPALVATTVVDATCIACHTPPAGPGAATPGQVLHRGAVAATSRTPPPLPGWSTTSFDGASGDFHGGRRGTCFDPARGPVPCAPGVTPTGYGGTLKAPWVRGQGPIPCATCHAGHASANAFLLAPEVNGTTVPARTIDRNGVGAERLCEACHAGGRHDRCKECHTDTIICPDGQCYMDPSATHVDPAPPGSGCFFCHGHEGILRWPEPYSGQGMSTGNCAHCHGFGLPPVRTTAPALPGGAAPVASGITATSARITWRTDEAATSWVEYGLGLPGWVAGSAAEVSDHAVTLTGLTPATTYVWRVRSVDAYRNVLRTAVASFTTTPPGVPPLPDLVPAGWTGVPSPQTTMGLALQWFPVLAPTGNAVEYRVELASDPAFTGLVNGSPPDSGWIAGAAGTAGGRETRAFPVTLTNLPIDQCTDTVPSNVYYWRVKARDAVTRVESEWSATDTIWAVAYDPYGC
jgi:hypothetical protein